MAYILFNDTLMRHILFNDSLMKYILLNDRDILFKETYFESQ